MTRNFMQADRQSTQRGIVLFFALIALLILTLAAAALIRSVDTTTLVAGNLAFKQAATHSGDAGIEAAINWLAATKGKAGVRNVFNDPNHPFNQDDPANGYYSGVHDNPSDPKYLDLFADDTWAADAKTSALAGDDPDPATGNTTRYIIQRMCQASNTVIQSTQCLFGGAAVNSSGRNIALPQDICKGANCPAFGQIPLVRITSRVTGPKNTVSYVQAFAY